MRQAGFLAAAGIYALDNHVSRLKEDHRRAAELAATLSTLPYIEQVVPVQTNLLFFYLDKSLPGSLFLEKLKQKNIHALTLSNQQVRFVTHLDFNDEQLEATISALKQSF
jgi:threonine aldolase